MQWEEETKQTNQVVFLFEIVTQYTLMLLIKALGNCEFLFLEKRVQAEALCQVAVVVGRALSPQLRKPLLGLIDFYEEQKVPCGLPWGSAWRILLGMGRHSEPT